MIGLVAKSRIYLKFWRPSVHKDSEAQACADAGVCKISVVNFKGIIQQVLVNKDLEIVYAVFGGGGWIRLSPYWCLYLWNYKLCVQENGLLCTVFEN